MADETPKAPLRNSLAKVRGRFGGDNGTFVLVSGNETVTHDMVRKYHCPGGRTGGVLRAESGEWFAGLHSTAKAMTKYKILIATVPADGHFNPLTGVAKYLLDQGHDVRWYTGPGYAGRIERLGIPFYPFHRARGINQDNLNELLPERLQVTGTLARIRFDIRHLFLGDFNAHVEDVSEIRQSFEFDVLLSDPGFMACYLIQEKFRVPAVVVGISPLLESSRDVPPNSLGLTPGRGPLGKLRDRLLRAIFPKVIFGDSKRYYNELIGAHGLPPVDEYITDLLVRRTTRFLQSGVPGFEYPRRDLHRNVRFVGPLLPYKKAQTPRFAYAERAKLFKKTILISQGTVDNKEPDKLIIPALDAFKNHPYLLLVATGGQHTEMLRERYPHGNIVIEDFIDYDATLPHTDLFVTCGGYGSVLLSLSHGVPMLAAGKHEGKNEIVARVGYFQLGVNLGTERPKRGQLEQGAKEIWRNPVYRENVARIQQEFRQYDPNALTEQYLREAVETFELERRVLA
jgi:MGT family glycosyltransferase